MEIQLAARSLDGNQVEKAVVPADRGVILIGRGESSPLELAGDTLSRNHFSVEPRDGVLYVTDLSSNGTWLNGTRLQRGKETALSSSDIIKIGDYEISATLTGSDQRQAVEASPVPVPEERSSFLSPILGLVGSFSASEKLTVLVALLALLTLLLYLTS